MLVSCWYRNPTIVGIESEYRYRLSMPLTDIQCRKAKSAKLKKLSDMNGLQLWIFPNGSRLWRYAYRFCGKQKLLALGKYPDVTLAVARAERDRAKDLLKQGHDPSRAKKLIRLETEYSGDSFETVATEYLAKLRREGRAEATITKVDWLLNLALPELGSASVKTIRPIEILDVLRKVEKRGRYDTARRLRSTIGAVFRYAVATARTEIDPTVPLQGALTAHTAQPRAAVTEPKAFGALLRAIDGFSGQKTTQAGLSLMALMFPRPGELRLAQWPEFDLEEAIWTIPAQRTKMRRQHRVPLAPQAIKILSHLHSITGGGKFVLPNVRTAQQPMSENTLNAALRYLGYTQEEATAHGFRASASTLLNEAGLWSTDAVERQLAHVESNDVRRAYARGEYWDERVKMMTWWANKLDELRIVGQSVPIKRNTARASDVQYKASIA
jgi:integrase